MDWGASGRRDAYRFTAVDPFSLADIRTIEAIPDSCSLTYGYYTDNYLSATLSLPERFEGSMLRVYHETDLPDGSHVEECLGTLFVDSQERRRSEGFDTWQLTCYSTLWRLSQDALASDYVVNAGSSCIAGLSGLISAEGASVKASPELPSKTHTKDVRFVAGDNRLESANVYAGWCGWHIGVDDYGYNTIGLYTPPANRSPVYAFEAGETCVYVPDSDETFTGDVCNRVIARWSEEKPPAGYNVTSMRAVSDLPATNAYSYQRAGRRITHVLDVEPCSQAELQAAADSYLSEHDAAIRYFEIEHAGIPHLRAGDTVTYTDRGETLLCEVTQMSISKLAPLMMTKSKLKVVG